LKMQMRPRRTASGTYRGDFLPGVHQITYLDQDLGCMGIACHQLVAVIDFHHVAVPAQARCMGNYAARGGNYGSTARSGEVDAFVKRTATGNGVDARAVR